MQPVAHIVAARILLSSWTSYRHYKCFSNILGMKGQLQRQTETVCNCSAKFLHRASVDDKSNLIVDTKSSLRKVLEEIGIEEATLNEAFHKEPKLLDVHPSLWEKNLKVLRASGFSGKECINMFIVAPSLLKTKPEIISLGLKNWQSTGLGDHKLISLFMSCPRLLFVEQHEINRRFPVLKSLTSQNNAVEFLRHYPDIMFVDWNDFLAKVNYVEEVMKISRNKISKCDILSCSLLELRTRHTFLERTGNYFPPNTKAAEHLPNKNPSLRQIIDSDDIYFATKLAGLTLEEFEVFRELYKEELNQIVSDDYDVE